MPVSAHVRAGVQASRRSPGQPAKPLATGESFLWGFQPHDLVFDIQCMLSACWTWIWIADEKTGEATRRLRHDKTRQDRTARGGPDSNRYVIFHAVLLPVVQDSDWSTYIPFSVVCVLGYTGSFPVRQAVAISGVVAGTV